MKNKTKSLEVLVIVDMQEWFLCQMGKSSKAVAARDKLVDGCLREIETAKAKRMPIVVLEYIDLDCDFGSDMKNLEYVRTIKVLRDALINYSRVYYTYKDIDDGSLFVMDVLRGEGGRMGEIGKGLNPDSKQNPLRDWFGKRDHATFVMCGVNASYCVNDTVKSLVRAGFPVSVPHDASLDVDTLEWADATCLTDYAKITGMKRKAS